MWKLIGKATSRWTIKSIQNFAAIRNYAAFTSNDIMYETSDEVGTLGARFAKHIALENQKLTPLIATKIRYSDYFPVTDDRYFEQELRRTSVDQLPALIVFSYTYRSNANPIKFAKVLNEMDKIAMKRIAEMDEDTVYRTLYAFLYLMPNWIVRTDFYHAAVRRLAEQDFKTGAPKERFLQLCFYLGLAKKHAVMENNSKYMHNLLETHLGEYLAQLNTMDLALVCNATYKTATSIHAHAAAFNKRIIDEMLQIQLNTDDAILVTFIKTMRLQRLHSKAVCEHLVSLCSEASLNKIQLRGLGHLFAYFVENMWDQADLISLFYTTFMERLRRRRHTDAYDEIIRGKDLNTFLYGLMQLNYTEISNKDFQLIETVVWELIERNHFKNYSDQLIEICLSLWALNHKSTDLLQEAYNIKQQSKLNFRQKREQPKVDSRLTVLLSAAAIEAPAAHIKAQKVTPFDLNAHVPDYLLKGREDLTKLLNKLENEATVAEVKITCPINGINIPGLFVRFQAPANATVLVELLKSEQQLHFSKAPVGIQRLKIRLLTALGHNVIVLRPEQLLANYTSLSDLVKAQLDANDNASSDSDNEEQSGTVDVPKQKTAHII